MRLSLTSPSPMTKSEAVEREAEATTLAERIGKAIAARQSPPGALGLPGKLELRRQQYNIPDEAFEMHAAFDRILLWQVDPLYQEKETIKNTFAGTSILMPETSSKRVRDETPRGVIVSAGLQALDNLRSNGLDVGHLVNFVRLSPWRIPIASYEGNLIYLIVLRDGDLIASEDLQQSVRSGKAGVTYDASIKQHLFVDEQGATWNPSVPFVDESY